MPLLVAPMPPQEPIAAPLVETTDETLAVEADNTSQPASDSKLWLLLAAAAGAFAMLFCASSSRSRLSQSVSA